LPRKPGSPFSRRPPRGRPGAFSWPQTRDCDGACWWVPAKLPGVTAGRRRGAIFRAVRWKNAKRSSFSMGRRDRAHRPEEVRQRYGVDPKQDKG
jgi:hypothetical protein